MTRERCDCARSPQSMTAATGRGRAVTDVHHARQAQVKAALAASEWCQCLGKDACILQVMLTCNVSQPYQRRRCCRHCLRVYRVLLASCTVHQHFTAPRIQFQRQLQGLTFADAGADGASAAAAASSSTSPSPEASSPYADVTAVSAQSQVSISSTHRKRYSARVALAAGGSVFRDRGALRPSKGAAEHCRCDRPHAAASG